MKKITQKILFISIFIALLYCTITVAPVMALTMKGVPVDFIKSPDGHITVGFEKEFGGAISYYRDDRILDNTEAQGNMINNSNSGALISTAIWTLKNFPGWSELTNPVANKELGLGWCDKRTYIYFPKPERADDYNDWMNNRRECYLIAKDMKSGAIPVPSVPPGETLYSLILKTTVPGTLPFNNPTQGGVGEEAWGVTRFGVNPNPTVLTVNNNKVHVEVRLVNFNYNFQDLKPSEADTDLWQTDIWNEMDVYFHPQYPDVLVVDQKITYCRDMNDGCKNQELSFQDNQLSTLFPATTIYTCPFCGPFEKFAFKENGGVKIQAIRPIVTGIGDEVIENWKAALNKDNLGIGEAVYKYRRSGGKYIDGVYKNWIVDKYVEKGEGYGSVGDDIVMGVSQPDLSQFENSGIRPIGSDPKDPRFTFNPGGWYKFRTFITTGELREIRRKLLSVTDEKMKPDTLTNVPEVESKINGYVDVLNCNNVFGWATESGNNGYKVSVTTEYTTVDGNNQYVKTTTAESNRTDLANICSEGNCAYGIAAGNFPAEFKNKKIRVRVWARAENGGINLLTYSDTADSIIGPCNNLDQIPGDLNKDNYVNIFDLRHFLTNFLQTFTIFDYNKVVENFGR